MRVGYPVTSSDGQPGGDEVLDVHRATRPSRSQCNTIKGTGPPGGGEPPVRMATNAAATFCAAP